VPADDLEIWEFECNFIDVLIEVSIIRSAVNCVLTGTGRPTSLGQSGPV
jgi:hypothetical protein